jgi:hypothetical protein
MSRSIVYCVSEGFRSPNLCSFEIENTFEMPEKTRLKLGFFFFVNYP